MKKVLAVLMMVLLIACMSFSSLAAVGEFVQSPSNNKAPVLEDATPGNSSCTAKIVITSYADRSSLSDKEADLLEKAYNDISDSKSVTELCKNFSSISKKLGIPETNLSVSDLFNVKYEGCKEHGNHGFIDLVISSDTFKNFVGLMYLTDNGWVYVDGATVKEVNGEYHLSFKANGFGPYAAVVNSSVIADKNPHTGDSNTVYVFAALMVISVLTVVALVPKKSKKQEA